MFEKAARTKLRFDYKGKLSVEDLWDLKPSELNNIYTKLRGQQNTAETDSLLTKSRTDTKLQLQVNLVKYVFGVKETEEEARKTRADNKMRKEKIATILAEKKDEGLRNMPIEELEKALKDMDYQNLFNLEIPGENRVPLPVRDARLRYAKEVLAYMMEER